MKCPHCQVAFHENWERLQIATHHGRVWLVHSMVCPSCDELVVKLIDAPMNPFAAARGERAWLVYPRAQSRAPLDPRVPEEFADDYREACLVLSDSPKASAALSRRCLQHLLREKAGVKKGSLNAEIDEAMKNLPSHLAEAIDAVRTVGNYAAHPSKSKETGEVVDVEPGEAEWNLDTLEGLFDHYFVQPELLNEKREAMNKKLADIGKPELKSAGP